MTYEEKMRALQWVKPENKDKILAKIIKGEKSVDITKDEDLFYRVNVDRMPMEDLINKRVNKYSGLAEDMKTIKQNLSDPEFGKTKDKKMRYMGEIPDEIYFTHPWFSPLLSREERDKNIRKFFNMFPAFRAGSKQI